MIHVLFRFETSKPFVTRLSWKVVIEPAALLFPGIVIDEFERILIRDQQSHLSGFDM